MAPRAGEGRTGASTAASLRHCARIAIEKPISACRAGAQKEKK
jgi:hypothetical protein